MPRRPSVLLRGVHYSYQHYFDYLATGLRLLAEAGEIEFRLHVSAGAKLARVHRRLPGLVKRVAPALDRRLSRGSSACVPGEIRFGDRTVRFAYDVGDSPFGFHLPLLSASDLYFKCQHPVAIVEEGFPLSSRVRVPFAPDVLVARDKIRPAMLGRPLSRTLDLRRNLDMLDRWRQFADSPRRTWLIAFFGTDTPPSESQAPGEALLMRQHAGQVSHPNYKRGEMVSWLRDRFDGTVDARIINTNDPSRRGPGIGDPGYPAFLASGMFNVNITGFRRSLPFRFIDSFLVGAGVLTDELAVKWYQPFEKDVEVTNLGRLGYELDADAEWTRAKAVIEAIAADAAAHHARVKPAILDRFERYWHPAAFARYIVSECKAIA